MHIPLTEPTPRPIPDHNRLINGKKQTFAIERLLSFTRYSVTRRIATAPLVA